MQFAMSTGCRVPGAHQGGSMTEHVSPVRRTQKRAAATKERLLDAAAIVFMESGYERATVADIARRAGVTVGAIYSNFTGKADMLLEVMRRRLKLQSDQVRAYVKAAPDINQAVLVPHTRPHDAGQGRDARPPSGDLRFGPARSGGPRSGGRPDDGDGAIHDFPDTGGTARRPCR